MWVPAQCGSNIMNLKYSWRWPRRQPAYVLECDEARDPQRGCRHDVMPVRPLAADCLLEVGTTWLEATHNWHTVRGPESQPWVAPDSTACAAGSQPASKFQVHAPVWAWTRSRSKPILHLTNRLPLALKSRGVVAFTAAEGFGDPQQVHQPCFSVIPAQKTPPISLKIILIRTYAKNWGCF
jgi:hypothetical protein